MTHKIRGVLVEEYAYHVNKLRQNLGLETWIWRQIVTSQTAHTKYKWPPHPSEWTPPMKIFCVRHWISVTNIPISSWQLSPQTKCHQMNIPDNTTARNHSLFVVILFYVSKYGQEVQMHTKSFLHYHPSFPGNVFSFVFSNTSWPIFPITWTTEILATNGCGAQAQP